MIVILMVIMMGMVLHGDSHGEGDNDGMVVHGDNHVEGDNDGYGYAR